MTLQVSDSVTFQSHAIDGAPKKVETQPSNLILDGQQRITSLYQAAFSENGVKIKSANRKNTKYWFYFDINSALDSFLDRENAIKIADENRVIRETNGEDINLSTPDSEYRNLMFPVSKIFNPDEWGSNYVKYWMKEKGGYDKATEYEEIYQNFKKNIIENFLNYRVPMIALNDLIKRDAICIIFDKVNTKGKTLDAFELVTAKFAAEHEGGYDLRKKWGNKKNGRRARLINWCEGLKKLSIKVDPKTSVLLKVHGTDFLQVISLLKTRDQRKKDGKTPVSGKRRDLLNLSLEDYELYEDKAEKGFIDAAEFLHTLHILRDSDLPYRAQLVPLAVILSELKDWKKEAVRLKLHRWYWSGVFGELYSSANETRMAWDVEQVLPWINGDIESLPATVKEASFLPDRLETMKTKQSAAYKGANALLLYKDIYDFQLAEKISYSDVFFTSGIDIHHIFPKKWCEDNGKANGSSIYNSIINKTPLSSKTNRFIGGIAPSKYIEKLDAEHSKQKMNSILKSHLINPNNIRKDDYEEHIKCRKEKLYELITKAMNGEDVRDYH